MESFMVDLKAFSEISSDCYNSFWSFYQADGPVKLMRMSQRPLGAPGSTSCLCLACLQPDKAHCCRRIMMRLFRFLLQSFNSEVKK